MAGPGAVDQCSDFLDVFVLYCAGVSTQWTIHGEKLVDENRHIRLSTVDITLPDGVSFTQYVVAMPPAAMTLVVNDQREVLLMRRHRFIIDRWVWELPGGYVDGAENIEAAAAREVEEETGWRPRSMEHMVTFQPAIGSVAQPQIIYLARGADLTNTPPDINEAQEIRWWPLEEAVKMIDQGEIVGASTVVAVYRALTLV
jgi:8-oxo-dGTP pyrophosphatase MutT (NUDIX family)